MTHYDLVHRIDNFIVKTGLSDTQFGLQVMNDGKLLSDLREGRDIKLGTYQRILSFMENYESSEGKNKVKHGGPSNGGN